MKSLTIVSDAKERKSRPDQGIMDNFESYLPYRVELDAFLGQQTGKNYPFVNVKAVQLFDSADSDLLQLVDLLLGALQNAVIAGARRETKRVLSQIVADWYQDVQRPPWEQKYGMYRKFNVWGFPDDQGRPFSHIPCKIVQQTQMDLF